MAINPKAVGETGGPVERSWSAKDAMLYAVGVGSGTDELAFSTEKNQKVLPTFATIIGGGGAPYHKLGQYDIGKNIHGEQSIELVSPIPTQGTLSSVGKIEAVWDKGSGAAVETSSEATDKATGKVVLRTRSTAFILGEGGFGGERGPSAPKDSAPDRKPDHEVSYATRPDQALTYRLSGDMNPLHSDPEFAKRVGYDEPILHGLCTYGFTGRALLHTLCGSDPAKFKKMSGRFSNPVIPGQTITIKMWVDGKSAIFQTYNDKGDIVLSNGSFTFA